MKYWSCLLLVVFAASLAGCGRDRDTLRKVDLLMEVNEYVKAFELLQSALREDPRDKTLRRAEIRLLLQAERTDLAYLRYRDFTAEVSRNDTVLLDALRDKNDTLRVSAARVLGMAGDTAAVPPLLRALNDPNKEVRRAAAVSLGDLKDLRALPGLGAALKDSWWFVRSEAASALGKLRDPRAIDPLFAALHDDDTTVRRSAESALTTIAKSGSGPDGSSTLADAAPFLKALGDSDPAVVHAAAFSLVAARNTAATPVLLGYLASPEPLVRQQGLRGLRYLLDPAALPAVRKALDDPEVPVRLEAILAVVDYRDKEAIPALTALQNNPKEDPQLRRIAEEAAGRLAALP